MQISSGDLLLLTLLLSSLHSLSFNTISPSPAIDDQLLSSQNHQKLYNVDDFGAKGDRTDDREAFMKAWKEACYSHFPAIFFVPEKKTYLLKPVSFYGPCNSIVTVMIMGTVEASANESDWDDNDDSSGIHWILFSNITDRF